VDSREKGDLVSDQARFHVDERVGCVAVIDLTIPNRSPGLHRTDENVVRFWSGRKVPEWKKRLGLCPGYQVWEVPAKQVRQAHKFLATLQEQDDG